MMLLSVGNSWDVVGIHMGIERPSLSLLLSQVRQASRDAALREVKERAKKAKAEKSQASKGAQSKAPVAKTVPKGKGR